MITPNTCCIYPNLLCYGFRKTKRRGKLQRFKCAKCGTVFVEKTLVSYMQYDEDSVAGVLLLHLEGLTEADISDFLGMSYRTVERWLDKFGALLNKFCSKFKPMFCKVLHCDELFLKLLNRFLYVWDSCAKDSKWLTISLSKRRNAKSAIELLQHSPRPQNETITDGAFSYIQPIRQAYSRNVKHTIALGDNKHKNNFIEGVQSTIRRFTRPRRGFKRIDKAVKHLRRYQHYYNFVKNHSAIGMPPAQKQGFVSYPHKANKKEKLLQLLNKAISFWQKLTNRICQKLPPKL